MAENTRAYQVVVYELNDAWYVEVPGLPLKPARGVTKDEALQLAKQNFRLFILGHSKPGIEIKNLEVVTIEIE